MTQLFDDVGECVEATLRRVGKRVVLAMPLGIGKPNPIANELYRRAVRDPSIHLTIMTALSLMKPTAASDLERRLVGPLVERVFGSYPDLDYAAAARRNEVPPNVRLIEFFFTPGASLGARHSQENHLSVNYTHVAREFSTHGVNVLAHLVAKRAKDGETQLSLGSSPDVTLDLLPIIAQMRGAGRDVLVIGQIHPQMPFMLGHGVLPPDRFDFLLEHPRYDFDLFSPPNLPIGSVDHAIGLHASALLRDGGTLQIGIGELGDAVVYSLLLRHQQNPSYRQALKDLGTEKSARLIDCLGGREPFVEGLFGSTEMFIGQMLDLYRAGILSRRVYDWLPIQQLVATSATGQRFDANVLELLPQLGVGPRLDAQEFKLLRKFGIFVEETRFERGRIRSPEGDWIDADLGDPRSRAALAAQCLGRELKSGAVLQAGFFLGARGFYAALRDLPERERRQFDMRGVGYINQLYGDDYTLRVLQRRDARFINPAMMVTLLGAAISDALEDGRVVSGVGGQYNYVSMAHALPDARAILCLRATRTKDGRTTSNLLWNYGHETIPRHLRDVVITEYGIADVRGKTDSETIAALLGVADSRFQQELLQQAKRARKIPDSYVIPDTDRANFPARLQRALAAHRRGGLFSEYPFGTDLSPEEIELSGALRLLKAQTATLASRLLVITRALLRSPRSEHAICLRRLGLETPSTLNERLLRRLVAFALHQNHVSRRSA
ncbi:MAG TPA: acetyl-CoA hydrolase/transferase C-terminal domain-containing protein [Steroidobacteraceae bacterium]